MPYTNCSPSNTTLETAWDLRGLSSEDKPTDPQMPNGSSAFEMDTGDIYFWDKANEQWRTF